MRIGGDGKGDAGVVEQMLGGQLHVLAVIPLSVIGSLLLTNHQTRSMRLR